MDSNDKSKSELKRLMKSFTYALQGLRRAFLEERNLQIHVFLSLVVISLGFITDIQPSEWIVLLLVIGGMFTMELLNTAIENVVDLVTKEYHPIAKKAKDIAAGAVLIYAITAVIVGIIIFYPYFF
ncbi:diacylglycerol kinase family protein [Fredinandcohnia sp. 179-A 10B2 NHS]|uniref:diacylglycerol kinase family protein n=1 Tax=Fredinandcohnia sp. 179-A 10B2 NHS TaxID=3235176 RepID=UPI0039A1C2ED